MQRARQLAWDLPRLGWSVEILHAAKELQARSIIEPDNSAFFAPNVIAHSASSYLDRTLRRIFTGLGWRSLLPLTWKAWALTRSRDYDLVYITTAQVPVFLTALLFHALRVPVVIDLHDPWHKEQVENRGGSLKNMLHQLLLRLVERSVVRVADGAVAVSDAYLNRLKHRYKGQLLPWARPGRNAVIPFAARQEDLAEARIEASLDSEKARVIYVGVGAPVMERAFSILCGALQGLHNRGNITDHFSFEFYGTAFYWRPGDRCEIALIAASAGLEALIHEQPARVSYRKSLEFLTASHGALILGVDDSAYMPSKMFSYLLSGKPVLAVIREEGAAHALLKKFPELVHILAFGAHTLPDSEAAQAIVHEFLTDVSERRVVDRAEAIRENLSLAMAAQHDQLFKNICGSRM